jgi:hypothetical protein
LARRHRQVLAKLDPVAIIRYQITEKDLHAVEQYLTIIQADLAGGSAWQEIVDFPSPYATSIAVHEIVEVRELQALGINPFKLNTDALQQSLMINVEAHIKAIYEEHVYLQDYISREFKQFFQVATLLKVNRHDERETDFQLLLESDIGVFIVEEEKLETARKILAQLKGEVV